MDGKGLRSFIINIRKGIGAIHVQEIAAFGMLNTIATGLAIDANGPIRDNAGGIAQMAVMSHTIQGIFIRYVHRMKPYMR
ncbi:pyrophosphate-energized vacuolar membrane proton pump 1-like [Phalaenopsis equestris]|uniref:pyrophosphate-energized vacuolar membrane proton pump 1-like n=1 Tax=Phalaenopsis equestris TaxID=78828 RepID=UPI0009E231F5|nr:pyrophosphate-energized vacuolar membrane proton pump 1-like [Phalaenopsis equestris]